MPINLLPWREQKIFRNNCNFLVYSFFIFLLIFPIIYGCQYYLSYLQRLQKNHNYRLAREIDLLKSPLDIKEIEASHDILQNQTHLIKVIQSKHWLFWQEFSLLQKNLPTGLQLNQIDWDVKNFKLQGETSHTEQIGELIKSLIQSHLFLSVDLNNLAQTDNQESSHFYIQGQHHWDSL